MEISNNQLIIDGNVVADLPELAHDSIVKCWFVPVEYRANGYFVSVVIPGQPEEIPACDMSDSGLVGELVLPASSAAVLDLLKNRKMDEINVAFDTEASALIAGYPEHEIKSWPQQVNEAEQFTNDPLIPTPLLTAIAAERGGTVADLAALVINNKNLLSIASGAIIGRRQAAINLINSAQSAEDLELIVF